MSKETNILGVITARGGSKGIPGKNIKLLGDKPLIVYTFNIAKKSNLITHLILSTDDENIANVAKENNVDVPFLRPKELAEDKTAHLPVMQHAIKFMEDKLNITFDYIVILQPTSPFRKVDDIDGTIQKLIDTNADSVVTLAEVSGSFNPIKIKKLDGDNVVPYCMEEPEGVRRQDLPVAYKRSGSVYTMKRDLIMNENKLFGSNVIGNIISLERYADIDEPLDWLKAEHTLEELKKKGYEF